MDDILITLQALQEANSNALARSQEMMLTLGEMKLTLGEISHDLHKCEIADLRIRLRNSVRPIRRIAWRPRTSPRLSVMTGRSPR
jgi:hypothetical protein